MAVGHFYSGIFGWFDFWQVYHDAVQRAPNHPTMVEVGVLLGKSLAYLGVELANSGKGGRAVGVDLFGGLPAGFDWPEVAAADHYDTVRRNLSPVSIVELVQAPSVDGAAKFADGSCDLVFIDAAHDYDNVLADLRAWWPKVKPGGVFAGHDYSTDAPTPVRNNHPAMPWYLGQDKWPEVAKAVQDWTAAEGLTFEVWGSSWRIVKGAA